MVGSFKVSKNVSKKSTWIWFIHTLTFYWQWLSTWYHPSIGADLLWRYCAECYLDMKQPKRQPHIYIIQRWHLHACTINKHKSVPHVFKNVKVYALWHDYQWNALLNDLAITYTVLHRRGSIKTVHLAPCICTLLAPCWLAGSHSYTIE